MTGEIYLVGYGTTLGWLPPNIIRSDGVRRVSESEYQTLLKAWLRMSQNQATDDGGTCYGDSGRPAFWNDDNNLLHNAFFAGSPEPAEGRTGFTEAARAEAAQHHAILVDLATLNRDLRQADQISD